MDRDLHEVSAGRSQNAAGVALPPVPAAFRLVEHAAQGRLCDLWKIQHRERQSFAALKTLRPEWQTHSVARELMHHEAKLVTALNSRYLVAGLDAEPTPAAASPAVLMEWLDGQTLEARLQSGEPLPIVETVWITRQCVAGLCDLAESGFAHGDLKPANIMLLPTGEVKLIDLGFARGLGVQRPGRDRFVTGTPEYLAPEILSRCPYNPLHADVYSLGLIVFQMLTGRLPFSATHLVDLLRQHRSNAAPRVKERRPDTPALLAAFVDRLLAKQPLRRPTGYRQMLRELMAVELETLPTRFAG